ncbi:hypothetical protein QTP86_024297 [Hemibagrus guttatus]|nr:hypothetical protein QTP86_024297 [Hemibagrus guttatus]
MDDLSADLREFLQNQPFLELTEAKKIRCTLNGHEFPCKLAELQSFTSGKKYKKLCAGEEFNYSQYEPHLVPSTKQPNRLFCKLTLRHLNRVPHHVLRHVSGKRFKKALAEYEKCMKQGVEFVPIRLRQKKGPRDTEDGMESTSGGSSKHKHKQKEKQKQDSGIWAPSSSEGEASDSEDSMSDLYPSTLFTLKKSEEQEEMKEEEDEFQTDHDMEVSEPEEEEQAAQKRKKQITWFAFSQSLICGSLVLVSGIRKSFLLYSVCPTPAFLSTMASSTVKFIWCSCRNYKIQSKDTHEKCLICLGIQHAKEAVLEYGKCPHCAKMDWSTCIKRLTKVQEVIHQEAQQRKNEASQNGIQPKLEPVASSAPVKEAKSVRVVSAAPIVSETENAAPAPSFSTAPVMFTLVTPSMDRPDPNAAAVKGTYLSHVALQHTLDSAPSVAPTSTPSISHKRRHSSRCHPCCMRHSSRGCGRRRKQSPSSSECSSWSSDSSCESVREKRTRREMRSSAKLDRKRGQLLKMVQQKLEVQQRAMQVQWSTMERRLNVLEKRSSNDVPNSAESSQVSTMSQVDQGQQTGTAACSGSVSSLNAVKQEDGPIDISRVSKSSLPPRVSSVQEVLTSEELQNLIVRAAKHLGINFPESQNGSPHPVMVPEFEDLVQSTWSKPVSAQPFRPVFSEFYKLHESQDTHYDHIPQVNKLMSAIFQAVTPASTREQSVPPEPWRFTEELAENSYQTAGMLAKTANYLRYLSDYQKRLLAETSENPTPQRLQSVFSELKLIGEFTFQLSSHQAELSGRIMAASVAVKRQTWMAKTNYTDSLKATFADLPFVIETQK